jgi:hypothetical protein
MPREATLSASEFKAKCLDLMAEGAARRLDKVHVTKYGKPFVSLAFEPEPPAFTGDSIFGCMKDWEGFANLADYPTDVTSEGIDEMVTDLEAQLVEILRRDPA